MRTSFRPGVDAAQQLSEEERVSPEYNLSFDEDTMRSLKTGKVPGCDGRVVEFY